MLDLEHRVLALKGLEPVNLTAAPRRNLHALGSAPEDAVAHLFPPARQHERMDVQRFGYGLHLYPWHPAELHGRQLELDAIAMHLLRPNRSTHQTPPSVS